MNKILITGGPGTGKTTLVDELRKKGYVCSEEIVRNYKEVIKKVTNTSVKSNRNTI